MRVNLHRLRCLATLLVPVADCKNTHLSPPAAVGTHSLPVVLFGSLLLVASCQKRDLCDSCPTQDMPPVAQAGPDQITVLPKDSVLLDGSASTDLEGALASYSWAKVSGPSPAVIVTPRASKTVIRSLEMGVYLFELSVKDLGGLWDRDTVQVTVKDPSRNQPPVAKAGDDQVIIVPANMAQLNGDNSYDADGFIATYHWTKVAGPSSYTLTQADGSETQVSGLVPGTYAFELTVTDDLGASSKDTVQVTLKENTVTACDGSVRALVAARLIPFGELPVARQNMAVASIGNKIFFAGGYTRAANSLVSFDRVDILDLTSNTWSTQNMNTQRAYAKTAVAGHKLFIAGGYTNFSPATVVDVYDADNNFWSSLSFPSVPTRGAVDVAAAAGNKVLFVSGTQYGSSPDYTTYTIVDIYDIPTNKWRTDTLKDRTHIDETTSDAGISATVIGGKVYLAGNASDWDAFDYGTISATIDIYDAATDSWSSSQLHHKRGYMGALAVGNKNYWAGGVNDYGGSWTDEVEIRDMVTGTSTFGCLSDKNAQFAVVQKGDQLVFFTSLYGRGDAVPSYQRNKFDIYDLTTNTWRIGVLPLNIYGSSVIAVNNTIYVAGGFVNETLSNKVWKLEF